MKRRQFVRMLAAFPAVAAALASSRVSAQDVTTAGISVTASGTSSFAPEKHQETT